jgi:UTP-glucose-1-phosphate uridylyltransferase
MIEDWFDTNHELEDMLKEKNKLKMLESINKPKNMANYTFIKQKERK